MPLHRRAGEKQSRFTTSAADAEHAVIGPNPTEKRAERPQRTDITMPAPFAFQAR